MSSHPITAIHRKRPRPEPERVPVKVMFKVEVLSIKYSEWGYVAALSVNGSPAMHVVKGDSIEVTV